MNLLSTIRQPGLIRLFPAFALYGLGTAALFAVDLIISTRFPDVDVADWAYLKAGFLLGLSISCVGLDHALIRFPDHRIGIERIAMLVSPIVTFLIAILLFAVDMTDHLVWMWLGLLASAYIMMSIMYFRAEKSWTLAQLAYALWRLGLLAIVIGALITRTPLDVQIALPATLMLSAFLIFALRVRTSSVRPTSEKPPEGLASVAAFVVIDIVLMNLSLSAEQLFMNGLGFERQSADYFRHVTFIVSPVIMFNTFIVFVLAPMIRSSPERYLHYVKEKAGPLLSVTLVLSAAMALAGAVIYAELVRQPLDGFLLIGLWALAFLRTLQGLANAYVTVLARTDQRQRVINWNLGGILFFAVVAGFGLQAGLDAKYAVLAGALAMWLIRTFATIQVTRNLRLEDCL